MFSNTPMTPNNRRCIIHVGLDDFDLYLYGCTTHAATYLIHELSRRVSLQLLDYPNLIRLNPSIPWKTRGNGAVALRIEVNCNDVEKVVDSVEAILIEYYEGLSETLNIQGFNSGTEPGVVIALDPLSSVFQRLYIATLTDVVLPDIVLEKLAMIKDKAYLIRRFTGRGIVGATAAVGWIMQMSDYTYEIITYRSKYKYLEERCVDPESVKLFDDIAGETTFNNIDLETGRILIVSHGFDPVLYGIRGDDVRDLKRALSIIRTCEPISAWTVFRTNQGTDAHAVDRSVSELRMYRTARLKLRVVKPPNTIRGGHVIVVGHDGTGAVELLFFRPSNLTQIAQELVVGDEIIVQGHVKPWRGIPSFHVEKINVVRLARIYRCMSPRCPLCGKRMTKMGFCKGYKCKYCKYTSSSIQPECIEVKRQIKTGLYIPPPSEQKHLIKPLKRYGKEKKVHPQLKSMPLDIVTSINEPLQFL